MQSGQDRGSPGPAVPLCMSKVPSSIVRILAVVAALTAPHRPIGGAAADEARCEAILAGTRQLILVTARTMDSPAARLQIFERDGPDARWRRVSGTEPAVVGRSGLAWGYPFRNRARPGETLKTEGDGRTPAGVYRIGRSFGFAVSARADHLVLRPGRTICVDDASSASYNSLVTVTDPQARPRGEDMGAEPLYRRGLVIDYPSDAATRAGSCIFLHIWRGPGRGTAGCVALPERRVVAIQDFSRDGAAIAILPEGAMDRFGACLPR